MIKYTNGNLLDSECQALVNTVNTVGIMGKGVALQFKNKFTANFKDYQIACQTKQIDIGKIWIFETGLLDGPKYILNFPTKIHWRGASKIDYIEKGLVDLRRIIEEYQIQSVALPPLGCGNGGLEWREVRPLIESYLGDRPSCEIHVFEPKIATRKNQTNIIPKMTVGRAALLQLMDRYLQKGLTPWMSLLEIHKVLYFLQYSGEDLRLKFVKAPFGPFAENLKFLLAEINGHFITGYDDDHDQPTKKIDAIDGVVQKANRFLSQHPETKERIERVALLIDGFEDALGLELLSTVHWLLTEEGVKDGSELEKQFYGWSPQKSKFSHKQIMIAYDYYMTNPKWLAHGVIPTKNKNIIVTKNSSFNTEEFRAV
ncbi:MAG: macro domain-containing protein [Candidatus Pacebacteria bacterium]|nr:macro domain-containing protein [Candidatus Paceibacterota bacterium]